MNDIISTFIYFVQLDYSPILFLQQSKRAIMGLPIYAETNNRNNNKILTTEKGKREDN